MKVKRRRQERTEEDKKSILKDYNAGMKLKDLMEKYTISKAGIYYILEQLENK